MSTKLTPQPPQWQTTGELYRNAIEACRELAEVMDPDDLLRFATRKLADALQRCIDCGEA